ncbi:unnamed protein product, partial [Adineta steineri]
YHTNTSEGSIQILIDSIDDNRLLLLLFHLDFQTSYFFAIYLSRYRRTIMFSYNYTNPCNNEINNNSNNCCPSSCYRPLQQIYKTTYSPMYGNNNASNVNLACICRPAERYKTANMSYGSFYYDNQLSTQKDRALNYDRAIFARCYDNNKKMGYQTANN